MTKEATFGLDENVAGALTYILGFISGIVFFLFEEDNEFVRFHALQSTITFLGIWIASLIVGTLTFISPSLTMVVNPIIGVISILLWIVLLIKAYKGEKYKLPIIGDIAENHV